MGAAAVSAMLIAPAGAAPEKKSPGEKVICRELGETGSRLATKRVCLTRDQWRQQEDMKRENLDKIRIRTGPDHG
jgi:hypothetical protein